MSLSREDVEKVALLARLLLSGEQTDRMARQLGQILEYVEQLGELDTEGVEPLAHPLELSNVFAPDQVQPSLPRERVLAEAPKHDGECFLVPAVLSDQ